MLLSIPVASYCLIERLALIYFPYTEQNHKLNGNGIRKLIRFLLISKNRNLVFFRIIVFLAKAIIIV